MNDLLKEALVGANVVNDQRGLNWSPAVDFVETDESFVIIDELPGLSSDEIDLKVEGQVVTLSAERQTQPQNLTFYRRERSTGTFSRSFTLPSAVEAGRISARLQQGVLEVVLPKS